MNEIRSRHNLKQRKTDEMFDSLLMCHRVTKLEMNFLVSLCANQYADVTNEHKCMILTVIQKIFNNAVGDISKKKMIR